METHGLRNRPTAGTDTSLPSLAGTTPASSSSSSLTDECTEYSRIESHENLTQADSSGRTLMKTVSFMADPKRRLSRQSSLSWGHKPSPIIGVSCFTFLLPIPFLIRVESYIPAFFLAAVTVSSFLSDHCYTGLESSWHTVDRILAPIALSSNMLSVYMNFGSAWASLSILAILCHLLANHYSKKGMYNEFVIWHSLWHAVGSGLIVFCYLVNCDVGSKE